jgi:DNA modification methylase
MKPVIMICEAIENSSHRDGIVLDVFGGSGSTLIACEKLDRKCLMMELDPVYCDVIIQRWENFTGKTAEPVLP